MAEPARPAKRQSRWPWVLLAMGLSIAVAALVLSRLLEPERLSAFLLDKAEQATGLQLELSRPADVGLWPDLHLELRGLVATAPGQDVPLFTAARVDLVLPWSSLLDRQAVVQRLRLVEPVLQREAFTAWIDSRPQQDPVQPFKLPELTAGVEVEDAAIVSADPAAWAVRGLVLDTSPLLAGQPFQAEISGALHAGDAPRSFALGLATTPMQRSDGTLVLSPLAITAKVPELDQAISFAGQLEFRHPDSLEARLQTELPSWPEQWPELPLGGASPIRLDLRYAGAPGLGDPLELSASAGDAADAAATLEARFVLAALLAWWRTEGGSALPPATARIAAGRLEFAGATLHGLEATLEPSPAAAAADQGEAQ